MKSIEDKPTNILDVSLDDPPGTRWTPVVDQVGAQICEVIGDTVANVELHVS